MDPAAYVLRDFTAAERKELPLLVGRAANAVETLLGHGLAVAQNTFHRATEGRDHLASKARLRPRLTPIGQAIALIGTKLVMWVMAISMSFFTQTAWYPVYDHIRGLTLPPLADQHPIVISGTPA
jgi:hypothetical protein